MNQVATGSLFAAGLFVGVLVLMWVGRMVGAKRFAEEGESASKGFGAVEGAVFGLMGLVLAVVAYFITLEAILEVRRLRHRSHGPAAHPVSDHKEPAP